MAEKARAKTGRPSKFEELDRRQVELLARAGWTDAQISEFYGVTGRTWENWKKKDPEFFQSLKDWKAEADHKVERSLYERATGYSHPEVKVATFEGVITDHRTFTKHHPPDTTAAIFWLKNRQPKVWRDKQEIEHDVSEGLAARIAAARDRASKAPRDKADPPAKKKPARKAKAKA